MRLRATIRTEIASRELFVKSGAKNLPGVLFGLSVLAIYAGLGAGDVNAQTATAATSSTTSSPATAAPKAAKKK